MKRLLPLLLLICAPAWGANWYVATTGSDSNSGTSFGAPFATFVKAVTSASAGDFVMIESGTYQQQLVVNKSGTTGNPITFQCTTLGACTITNVGSTKIAILVSHQNYITFNGINVSGGQLVPFANTVSANHCLAASFAPGGAPNVQTWIALEGAQNIIVQNGSFQYATGYWGVEITGFYLANGNPLQSNTAGELSGTAQFITIQNNTFDLLGNFLDQTAVCGDIIDIYNSANVSNHILIQNNLFTHAAHNCIEDYGSFNVITNNVCNNTWSDLLPSLGHGVPAGYRAMEENGNHNIIQYNLFENSGYTSNDGGHFAPIVDMHGMYNLDRWNIFYNAAGNAINTDCGYGGLDDVEFDHYAHNTIHTANSMAFSFAAYSTDPCIRDGNHVIINNLVYNDRMLPTSGGGSIIQEDTDILHNLVGATSGFVNVGLGNIGQIAYISNLIAPSLTNPTSLATRPASLWNFGVTGQSPMCLSQAGITGCPNTTSAETTFPSYVATSNLDAGETPTLRPVFVAVPTPTTATYGLFALTPTSPGVDEGVPLTTTTAGGTSSTTIPVADAYFFTAGLGIIPGDSIELATHQTITTVTAITYGTYPAGTLTVSPAVTFNNGEGVTYPFTGTAPDIGAIELNIAGGPPVVQPKTWSLFQCASDGKVYSDPTQCH